MTAIRSSRPWARQRLAPVRHRGCHGNRVKATTGRGLHGAARPCRRGINCCFAQVLHKPAWAASPLSSWTSFGTPARMPRRFRVSRTHEKHLHSAPAGPPALLVAADPTGARSTHVRVSATHPQRHSRVRCLVSRGEGEFSVDAGASLDCRPSESIRLTKRPGVTGDLSPRLTKTRAAAPAEAHLRALLVSFSDGGVDVVEYAWRSRSVCFRSGRWLGV